jgi:hypothetical protein
MKGWTAGLLGLAILFSGAAPSHAAIIQLLSTGSLNPGDTTVTYPGIDGLTLASGFTISGGGNTVTFSDANSQAFLRADQGNTWTPGAYPNTTKLIWNLNPNTNVSGGAVTISFSTPVHEVGLSVQQDDNVSGSTTFSFQGFNGATPSSTFTVVSSNTAGAPNGTLSFIGVGATSTDTISKIVISSSDTGPGLANDFVLGPVTFSTTATSVPEPSPLLLGGLATSGLFVAGQWRRRRQTAAA